MSEEAERTEEATPKRRQDARDEGRVARSQELAIAASLLGSALVLGGGMPALGQALLDLFGSTLGSLGATELTVESTPLFLRATMGRTMFALAGVCAALAAAGVVLSIVQARGTLTTKPLEPKLDKLNVVTNAKNLLRPQQLVELLKSLLKLGIVAWAVWRALGTAMPEAASLVQQEPLGLADFVRRYALRLMLTAGGAYLALAVADYAWQWWQFEKGLRMSKEEVRQEYKESEGDPHVKGRRKQVARQYARKQMLADVKRADVVVVNPVHIAVAIRYAPDLAPAPVVVAMGKLLLAERIKDIAREAGVPIVENKPVARALIKSARVGTIIPVEMYVAVAEILAFVIRTRASRGRWAGSAVA